MTIVLDCEHDEEVTNRRIGRNELAAMQFARNYVQAQRVYASVDRDGDQVLECAQHLISTQGRQDDFTGQPGRIRGRARWARMSPKSRNF